VLTATSVIRVAFGALSIMCLNRNQARFPNAAARLSNLDSDDAARINRMVELRTRVSRQIS